MNNPFARRNSAGSFTLPAGIDGPITELVVIGNQLEIYTPTATVVAQTPEAIDPDRTNPNIPWVQRQTDTVGSSHPAVARTLITAYRAFKANLVDDRFDKTNILTRIHSIKTLLVACDKAKASLAGAIDTQVEAFNRTQGALDNAGLLLQYHPHVADLEALVTSLLVNAKRVTVEVCQLIAQFWPMNHTALQYVVRDLTPILGENDNFLKWLSDHMVGTTRIVSLRNGQEHNLTTAKPLHISNFQMLPTGQMRMRSGNWRRRGGRYPRRIERHRALSYRSGGRCNRRGVGPSSSQHPSAWIFAG